MTQDRLMNSQIRSLTSLRGIAAISVVLHHYTQHLLPEIGSALLNYTLYFSKGYLWVDFFFLLSGVVLGYVYSQYFIVDIDFARYKKFLIARLARIYPLHFLMLLGLFSFELLSFALSVSDNTDAFNMHFSNKVSIAVFIENLFLLQGTHNPTTWNEPSWSIGAEWFVYLLFPLLCYVLTIKKLITLVASYCCLLVILFELIILTSGDLDLAGWPAICRAVIEFTMGLLLYKLYINPNFSKFFESQILLLLAFASVFLVMHYDYHDIFAIPALSLLILTASIHKGKMTDILNSPGFVYLGDISYSVYMIHWPIYIVITRIWMKLTQQYFGEGFSLLGAIVVLYVCVGLVLLISSVTYNKFEIPMRNYIKSRFINQE